MYCIRVSPGAIVRSTRNVWVDSMNDPAITDIAKTLTDPVDVRMENGRYAAITKYRTVLACREANLPFIFVMIHEEMNDMDAIITSYRDARDTEYGVISLDIVCRLLGLRVASGLEEPEVFAKMTTILRDISPSLLPQIRRVGKDLAPHEMSIDTACLLSRVNRRDQCEIYNRAVRNRDMRAMVEVGVKEVMRRAEHASSLPPPIPIEPTIPSSSLPPQLRPPQVIHPAPPRLCTR